MKKMTALLLALFVLVTVSPLFAGGGGQSGGAAGPRVLRMADNQPDTYPTNIGNFAFAKYVEEKTNGAIKIEVYPNATLGGERETLEMTQTGSIAFNRMPTSLMNSINPLMAALSLPFLYRDRAHMFKVVDGPIGQEMLESLQKQNLLGLCWYDAGFRNFYNSKKEIRTPADMAGLKIRVQESALMMDMVRFLGASPTPMAFAEVYTGIQNGVVDGAENNWPSYIAQAHFEVAKYFTINQHIASPEMVLINTEVWKSLSDAEKKIIKDGAMEGARVERASWLEAEKRDEAKARAAGSIITEITPAEHQQFVNALMPLYDQPAYAAYKDLIQRIRDTK